MSQRAKSGNGTQSHGSRQNEEHSVIDFAAAREKKLEQKVRQNERVVFGNLLSVYFVDREANLHPIEMIEMSESGLSFQIHSSHAMPVSSGADDEIPVRLYFSQDTYLEIFVSIKNTRPSIENGEKYNRFGCLVDTTTQSFPAYQLFVQFLKQYAVQSHRDMGKVSAFYR